MTEYTVSNRLIGSRRVLFVDIATSLVLPSLALLGWLVLRIRIYRNAIDEGQLLGLPDDLSASIQSIRPIVVDAFALRIVEIFLLLGVIFLVMLYSGRVFSMVTHTMIGRIPGYESSVHARERFEQRLEDKMTKANRLGGVLSLASLLVLVVFGSRYDILRPEMAATILAVTVTPFFMVTAAVFLSKVLQLVREVPEAREEFRLAYCTFHQRLTVYTNLAFIGAAVLVSRIFIFPWAIEQADLLGGRVSGDVTSKLASLQIKEVEQRALDFVARSEDSIEIWGRSISRAERKMITEWYFDKLGTPRLLETLQKWNIPEEVRAGIYGFVVIFAVFVISYIVLVFYVLPSLIGRFVLRRVVMAHGDKKKIFLIGFPVLLALLNAFILDRLGATSARPLLWLSAFIPIALADVVFSLSEDTRSDSADQACYLAKSRVYHLRASCSALRRVAKESLLCGPVESLKALGLKPCKICLRSSGAGGELMGESR